MKSIGSIAKQCLLDIACVVLTLLGMLLFVALAVVIRPLLAVVFLGAAVTAVVLSCFSKRFRAWLEAPSRPEMP
jgi:4-hydroxybenzoate polyprenyltransferase